MGRQLTVTREEPYPFGPKALHGLPLKDWLTSQLLATVGLAEAMRANVPDIPNGEWLAAMHAELQWRGEREMQHVDEYPMALQEPDATETDADLRGWFDNGN